MPVLNIIRKLIEDIPQYHEDVDTLNNNLYYKFKHSPIIPISLTIDGVSVPTTYDEEVGIAIFGTEQTGTISVRYQSVWFSDNTINQILSYQPVNKKLLLIDTNTFAFDIPQYPVRFITKDESGNVISSTFDEDSMQFHATSTTLIVEGVVADIYNTVGTLLLLKASNPQKIRREFLSFTNWGDYPNVAQGLREQADYWFKFSGR